MWTEEDNPGRSCLAMALPAVDHVHMRACGQKTIRCTVWRPSRGTEWLAFVVVSKLNWTAVILSMYWNRGIFTSFWVSG